MVLHTFDFLIILMSFSRKKKDIAFFTVFKRPFNSFITVRFIMIRNAAFLNCRKSIFCNFLNSFVPWVIAC